MDPPTSFRYTVPRANAGTDRGEFVRVNSAVDFLRHSTHSPVVTSALSYPSAGLTSTPSLTERFLASLTDSARFS